jgi:NADPH:quinone reductase-like Zn-dependent oxidoreductase
VRRDRRCANRREASGRIRGLHSREHEDLQTLADMLESGGLKPAIDRTYELAEGQDALRVFGERHVRGKLVLTI